MKREFQSPHTPRQKSSRRQFLGWSGKAAVGSALAGVAIPTVHAAENNTIKLALVGCGSRGSGAVANAFSTTGETKVLTRTRARAVEEGSRLHVMPKQVSVGDLARALNAMGLTPSDLVSVFQALKDAGALQAKLIVR